ncbi:MAG: hypothetical protein GY838_12865 [bacterium]|nr:hypothetical protein [bacterium]
MSLFDQITVNVYTGAISYPKLEGFELDMEEVYRVARLMGDHCSAEMAFKHAIHQQLAAFRGLATLRAKAG